MIVAVVLVLIAGKNAYYKVNEQEQAVVTMFGKVTDVKSAGLYFKVPFIENVHKVDTTTHGMQIGYTNMSDPYQQVYTTVEYEALMITSDFNLLNIDFYIEHMLRMGVKVVAPRWNGETYCLARLKGLDDKHLRRGPMGIREPVDDDIVPPQDVYAWIVPGLAFTRDGKRLGYGGGWYDRLLASAPKSAAKIGVAYSFQIVSDLPAEPHDIPLTDVVDDSLDEEERLTAKKNNKAIK